MHALTCAGVKLQYTKLQALHEHEKQVMIIALRNHIIITIIIFIIINSSSSSVNNNTLMTGLCPETTPTCSHSSIS